MSIPQINCCPGTLAEGFKTYSNTCLRRVFKGKKVNHVLSYDPPSFNSNDTFKYLENKKYLSISGVQEKVTMVLEKNLLRLTQPGERSTYILKPIPRDLMAVDQVPANEHLTMQIARQVYGIATAENALIFFQNGESAYITKRFDVKEDGSKHGVEDFASLAEVTEGKAGKSFKYSYSYEQLGALVQKFVPSYRIELEKLYTLIIFNFLFSNGDAHLKNFSVIETPNGDHVLSPAYDLLNTRLHVNDTDFALDTGLFQDDYESKVMRSNGHVGLDDFHQMAHRWNINEKRRDKILTPFLMAQPLVKALTNRSFLNLEVKNEYLKLYEIKRSFLNMV